MYRAVLPRLLRTHASAGMGFSSPSYNRLQRSHEFYEQVADELGDWWWRIAQAADDAEETVKRRERRHHEDAATELADIVRVMSPPVRNVVELRAVGLSWRRIFELMPDRAFFSIRDDFQRALTDLWTEREELIRRIV